MPYFPNDLEIRSEEFMRSNPWHSNQFTFETTDGERVGYLVIGYDRDTEGWYVSIYSKYGSIHTKHIIPDYNDAKTQFIEMRDAMDAAILDNYLEI